MQIIIKFASGATDAVGDVMGAVAAWLGGRRARAVRVRKIFPKHTRGNRARLYTVDLPRGVGRQQVGELLASLNDLESLEYAEIPSVKRPPSAPMD